MDRYVDMFKALGNSTRLRIFMMLQVKSLCVCEIKQVIGYSMSTLSNHLRIMKDAHLILAIKDNKYINFQINTANPKVKQLLDILKNNCDEEFADDKKKAAEADRDIICG